MNEEELRKKMEFIIEQQAQFAADIQQLRETQEAEAKLWREKHNSLTDALTTVVGIVGKLAEAQERAEARLAELAEAQKHTNTQVAETNERLNIFINVVERYISERRNGQAQGDGNDESAPAA